MYADAARSTLSAFIDYAGLFPPAELSMKRAVEDFVANRDGEHGWMQGRFLCPASRLDELATALRSSMGGTDPSFRVRIVSDGEVADDVARARAFAAAIPPGVPEGFGMPAPFSAGFDMFEVRWDRQDLDDLLDTVFEVSLVTPVIEVPFDGDVDKGVRAIAEARAAREQLILAKIRCGGLLADAFPTAEQVARFIGACARAGLPFKATAGLHQPFRHFDEATGFTRHGFVNLRAAALLGPLHDLSDEALARIVDDRDPDSFVVTKDELRWGPYAATAADIAQLHWRSLVAYGSCDFAEPVEALRAAGILPVSEPPPPDPSDPGPVY